MEIQIYIMLQIIQSVVTLCEDHIQAPIKMSMCIISLMVLE